MKPGNEGGTSMLTMRLMLQPWWRALDFYAVAVLAWLSCTPAAFHTLLSPGAGEWRQRITACILCALAVGVPIGFAMLIASSQRILQNGPDRNYAATTFLRWRMLVLLLILMLSQVNSLVTRP